MLDDISFELQTLARQLRGIGNVAQRLVENDPRQPQVAAVAKQIQIISEELENISKAAASKRQTRKPD